MSEYYILDTRTIVGNCAMFWGVNGGGYVCDLKEAGRYDEKYVRGLDRPSDVPIPCDEVEKLAVQHVRVDGMFDDVRQMCVAAHRIRRQSPPSSQLDKGAANQNG